MSREAGHFHTYGNDWTQCSLCRSSRLAIDTYNRTVKRKVDWPDKSAVLQEDPLGDDVVPISHQEAFENIIQLLAETTDCCKRYQKGAMRSAPSSPLRDRDCTHRKRYHTPQTVTSAHRTQYSEVTVSLPRGSYSIESSKQTQENNNNNNPVLLNFSL
eukprot:TRINITY_DN2427_c0_g2_i1.p1 TRINITY_DN2427_c0_g2~~TRINITY_DN2427_c0_g2_i1.p1  ORF type:complete len:182 (-),score=39.73 TRINITY_DN2427_c0_g2_i1:691-1164(-)